MHNIGNNYYQSEFETGYQQEVAYELSPEFEIHNEYSNEYNGESSYELNPEFEFESSPYGSGELELELAQELSQISNELEFGGWLKKVGKKGAGLAAGFLNSSAGRQATAALGKIAQKTLPGLGAKAGGWLGGRMGGWVGRGAQGQQWGAQMGSRAGQYGADRFPDFVRFATDTLQNLSQEFEAGRMPQVKAAIVKSATKHYPIVLQVRGTLQARPIRNSASSQEFEYNQEFETDGEFENEFELENNYEFETDGETDGEMEFESGNQEGTFNEVTEMELASELLSIQNEMELDQFLGKLIKKGLGAAGKFMKSGTGKALGGMLKGIAKKALPIAGGAVGNFFLPGIGGKLGGMLGRAAGNLFELELEGLSAEDREFEMSKAFVRFAGNAARRASRYRGMDPRRGARQAILSSARRYAPGLLLRGNHYNNYHAQGNGGDGSSGTWYRQGGRIVIEGA